MKTEKTKMQLAAAKAIYTDKWTQTMFNHQTNKMAHRWKFTPFRGKKKRDSKGVVDVLAIRRNTADPNKPPLKANDLFEFILVQLKGGGALFPSQDDLARLWAVRDHYDAKEVVLFERRKSRCTFSVLRKSRDEVLEWVKSDRHSIFGKPARSTRKVKRVGAKK